VYKPKTSSISGNNQNTSLSSSVACMQKMVSSSEGSSALKLDAGSAFSAFGNGALSMAPLPGILSVGKPSDTECDVMSKNSSQYSFDSLRFLIDSSASPSMWIDHHLAHPHQPSSSLNGSDLSANTDREGTKSGDEQQNSFMDEHGQSGKSKQFTSTEVYN